MRYYGKNEDCHEGNQRCGTPQIDNRAERTTDGQGAEHFLSIAVFIMHFNL